MLKGKVTIQEQEVSGNYKFVGIPMYMTKGFQETFGEETNAVAFTAHMLLLEKYPNDADYFQVFLYSYPDGKEVKFWLINDVSHMTFLLPSEYQFLRGVYFPLVFFVESLVNNGLSRKKTNKKV